MNDPGSEVRRALIGFALGAALGVLAAVFARRDATEPNSGTNGAEGVRLWRGRSRT